MVRCRMQWCQTDLGANVYSWQRLLAEGRRFSAPGPEAEGLGAEHYDGVLASAISKDGGSACNTRCSSLLPAAAAAAGARDNCWKVLLTL